ncbi:MULTISPECIES: restriction endonuclease subunit S [unclassified Mesotoga]|jgi:type I restriction enzyme S subunit|uniref:restriction endonuclease subunit S n=1 Tax=unclassified Mesotoga TaxID=1184398 RepID=UPI001BD1E5A7|nr:MULTISPECIES: restriction endonuclease subunit S [unclassified Mesotoga]
MREDIKKRIEQIRRGEVPEGYKNLVDYHIIPIDWRIKKLEDLGSLKNGINKDKDMFGNGYPLVNLDDVFASKCISSTSEISTLVFCSEQERASYSLRNGDIIFVRSSVKKEGVGLTAYVTEDLSDTVFSGFLIRFRCLSDSLVGSYKVYCFDSTYFRDQLLRKSTVSANTNINQEQLKILKIALPCTNEQEQIAEILSTCDRVIELKKKLIEEKKKVKKWLMQTLLTGMIRVKDIENKTPFEELKKRIEQIRNGQVPEGYRKTELGIISHDWEITGLEKICKLIIDKRGKTPKQDSSDGDIPGLSAHNVRMGKIDFTFPTTYYSEDVFNRWMKNEKIEKEDIIMTTEAPLGNIALVEETRKYILGQRVVALRLKDSVNSIFGKHLLMSNIFQRKLQELATGTTAKGLSKRNLKYLKVYIPDTETQKAVSSILSTADTEIDLLNKDLEQWELKKKSLMQLLLTGIVRIKA